MPAHTENTITDRDELKEVFEQIRESDVSFDHEEYRMGMASVSTVIEDSTKTVLGGLSITGPAHRLREPDVEEELRRELLSARNIIELNYSSRMRPPESSQNLGSSPGDRLNDDRSFRDLHHPSAQPPNGKSRFSSFELILS